jgi:site-specific recombinase XerD
LRAQRLDWDTEINSPLAAFVAFLAEQTRVSERTARLYVAHLRRFARWLAAQYQAGLLEATGADLRAYRAELARRQRPASVNAALAALRRFYAWAVAAGLVDRDPVVHLPGLPQQMLAPKGFSDRDRRRLVRAAEAAGPMTAAIVATLLHTGLRVDELVGLVWERVTLGERSGWAEVVGKRQRQRRVPLNAEARRALRAIRPQVASPNGPLFRGKRGPYTARGVEYLLARLGRRAEVKDVHPHRFRHDTARRLVEATDLPTVAAWLGHERLDTVRLYSQPDEAALERAAAALEQR